MPQTGAEHVQTLYDRVADTYDNLWSRNVAAPNARLTDALGLRPGERLADLACGTGVFTLDMARRVAPAHVEAVDYSAGMLAEAKERAASAGLVLDLKQASIEDFVSTAPRGAYDVISVRFALAYIDWRGVLPHLGGLLAPGGRVGILTSLASSIPQLHELYLRIRDSFGAAWKLFKHFKGSLREAWRSYRLLKETFGRSQFITMPGSPDEVSRALAAGGAAPREQWTQTVRLWFATGQDVVRWMLDSGYAAYHALDRVGPRAMRFVEDLFAAGMETYREPRGVPLDLVLGGVVSERKA